MTKRQGRDEAPFPVRPGLAALVLTVALAALPAAAAAQTAAPAATAAGAAANLPVLSLKECVDLALGGSLSLATAQESRESAAQGVTRAWGAFLPSLSLSRQYSKNKRRDFDLLVTEPTLYHVQTDEGVSLPFSVSSPTGEVADEKLTTTYQDYGFDSGLNLFDGLGKYGTLKSARSSVKAAEASAAYTREQVIENVVAAYFDLLRYERLRDVAGESRDLAARELERTEVYFQLGSAAKSDVLQAKVRHEQTRLDLVRAENAVEQAFAALAHAMNQPLAARFEIERSAPPADFAADDLDRLYAEALANRQDLRSRAYQAEARAGDVQAASAGLWPSLDVFLSYSRYKNESPYRFGAQESDNLGYGYRVNWNVFDRFQSWTSRAQAKAQQRIAEYSLEQARLDAQLEIRQLYNALVEARERVSLSRETITQAEEALRLAQERFRVGAGTTLDTITAQVSLASARADEVQAICDWLIVSARLDRAVGRPVRYLGGAS